MAPRPASAWTTPRRLASCALLLAAAVAAPAQAQEDPERAAATGAVSFGGGLQVAQPRGEFDRNTGTGYGLGGHALFRLDPNAILNWRADLGFLVNGSTTQRISFPGTGNLVQLDMRTTNNIFSLVTGPQLLGPTGAFTPYASALGGFSVFWTSTSLEGSDNNNQPFASTTNLRDAVWAYGGAAGAYIRLTQGRTPVRLDLGVRYLRHDDVRYLNTTRVREAVQQDRDPIPFRSRADFVTYYVGVNVWAF